MKAVDNHNIGEISNTERGYLALTKWCTSNNVSNEALHKLQDYLQLLIHWNKSINLVSPASLEYFWDRHVLNSAILLPHITQPVVDIGAGAGFPAIVLAILGAADITLIESNTKKAIFLTHVLASLKLKAKVICGRAETQYLKTSTITSRACAKVDKLLEMVKNYEYGQLLLLKGENYLEEIEQAQRTWRFKYTSYPTSDSFILSISEASKIS